MLSFAFFFKSYCIVLKDFAWSLIASWISSKKFLRVSRFTSSLTSYGRVLMVAETVSSDIFSKRSGSDIFDPILPFDYYFVLLPIFLVGLFYPFNFGLDSSSSLASITVV